MAVNKVNFGDNTLIDLTNDTVQVDTLLNGVTAHAANGEQIVGEVNGVLYFENPQDYYDLSEEEREAINELVILNEDGEPLDASLITYGNGSVADALDGLNITTSELEECCEYIPININYNNTRVKDVRSIGRYYPKTKTVKANVQFTSIMNGLAPCVYFNSIPIVDGQIFSISCIDFDDNAVNFARFGYNNITQGAIYCSLKTNHTYYATIECSLDF